MTGAHPLKWFESRRVRRGLPYLGLSIGLVLATAPTWWMMTFGVDVDIDTLLKLRCAPWLMGWTPPDGIDVP